MTSGTRKKKDYSKCKIYMIEPLCPHEEHEVYYGSTCKELLSQRFATHTGTYRYWKKTGKKFYSSFLLFDKYGIDNCKIYLVKPFPCLNHLEAEAEEGHYQRNNNCINRNIAGRTPKEYNKEYYTNNKNQILEHNKKYYIDNKENISERKKEYYNNKKDKMLEYQKEYYKNNKDKRLEYQREYYTNSKNIIECPTCKCFIYNLSKHTQSKKHNQLLLNQPQEILAT